MAEIETLCRSHLRTIPNLHKTQYLDDIFNLNQLIIIVLIKYKNVKTFQKIPPFHR